MMMGSLAGLSAAIFLIYCDRLVIFERNNLIMRKFIERYIVVIVATFIFLATIITKLPFYKAVTFIFEFIVMIEIVRMVVDFIDSKRVRLRYVIDIFIIFLIRDVVIQVTQPKIDEERILFLLFVIFVFFVFRLMSIFYSPSYTAGKNIDK